MNSSLHHEALARRLGELLKPRGQWVCTAESCTGGGIASAITDIAGSSGWFGYGFVTYSNAAKQRLLGVKAETLLEYGAVSEPTVRQMAEGALAASGADWAVAVSGIAGPGGGTADKPVGLVWFAVAGKNGVRRAFRHVFPGSRAEVREATVREALTALLAEVEALPLQV
jgi:nicotinamide-nucleotide amidase